MRRTLIFPCLWSVPSHASKVVCLWVIVGTFVVGVRPLGRFGRCAHRFFCCSPNSPKKDRWYIVVCLQCTGANHVATRDPVKSAPWHAVQGKDEGLWWHCFLGSQGCATTVQSVREGVPSNMRYHARSSRRVKVLTLKRTRNKTLPVHDCKLKWSTGVTGYVRVLAFHDGVKQNL